MRKKEGIPKGFVGFVNDELKLAHYMKVAGFDKEVYKCGAFLKIYEGGEILLYHYDHKGLLTFDTVLVCSGFMLTEKTMQATFIDRTTFQLVPVRDVPEKIRQFDILFSMPVRCLVERTLKVTKSGSMLHGMASAVYVQTKSDPGLRALHHMQAVNLTQVHKRFSKSEFAAAENRAALRG